ncbi:tRNA (N(6)-L-threonylcarbamoyladenosine(37)-C(2))-methylthiotransferase MtaB [Dehalobacterium formicoaceticum]|uniref:tRNA-2-methylthio-N(6)-dimethylallyladenosine synthase n=1 Tax=Dehalobacterium formicoaceticum TaxID=51515 RepID=A0ABT1Y234_9FIRM|nr:tRNA (N(6)-L-threonylcarbamoyladenosine(37)-C(2))-methylthiotransferase MtaB [Dehalobacterium formicoaceticum]MCR6544940.1 tRNA (N(6)-L-threonylcarbamoyladenosine(37)-C(2))-methylthiotransferase MtaB [Dehalobacterium formicoaceticum]
MAREINKSKVAVCTLGCKVNQNETDAIVSSLIQAGFQEVPFEEKADLYVINTCTVTHLADRKSRQMVRRAIKNNPAAMVVVTGCYAQTSPGDVLGINGVDLVIGTQDRHRLLDLLEEAKAARKPLNVVGDIMQADDFEEITGEELHPHMVRAYLKIQEGCNQYCSYCIIPYARGPVRSRPLERVLEAAKQLVYSGYKEIILTGIHTGAYGSDLRPQMDLAGLVGELVRISDLKRLRISSLDPNEINEELLQVMTSSPILCPHLHISLQSGDDEILGRMNRHYDTAYYLSLVERIRRILPDIAFTTDIMVGFPGETEEAFQNTYDLVEKIGFSGLHVFKYSPRKGTAAASFPDQISPQVKEERSKRLIALGERLSREYARKYLGRTVEVLAEQRVEINGENFWEGHSGNYLKILFAENGDYKGQLVSVSLERYQDNVIFGHLKK